MRPRLWTTILEIDVQCLLTAGKPLFISCDDCKCGAPSNIEDEDINETDLRLSEPKSADTFTRTSIQIALRKSLPDRAVVVQLAMASAWASRIKNI